MNWERQIDSEGSSILQLSLATNGYLILLSPNKRMPLFPRFSSPTTHIVTDIPDWDDTMGEFSSLSLGGPLAPPYDSAKSTFSYQLRYHDSVTNPGSSLCDLWCVSDKTCQVSMMCHMMAITFLVDTPLPLLLLVKEPPLHSGSCLPSTAPIPSPRMVRSLTSV